ncbi:hypothetical protein O6H91_20G063700 [Diphasiastrum complanatum]|uniref:Uncharacterized protein n=1 Tax=Diphasiastrum complanatum TaxID=34168 RepID=A0ACC2AR42_DIPCM|nr:hypothetical protein O6H91_20G063700 [Diphasiastrum complanatum]
MDCSLLLISFLQINYLFYSLKPLALFRFKHGSKRRFESMNRVYAKIFYKSMRRSLVCCCLFIGQRDLDRSMLQCLHQQLISVVCFTLVVLLRTKRKQRHILPRKSETVPQALKKAPDQSCKLFSAVDFRSIIDPPLPSNYADNAIDAPLVEL